MGNHLNIGIGQGDATVFNSAPAIQGFTNILAQQKAQRDAERQQMIEQMGKIDPSKIRQGDQQDYYNKFNDWKQASIAAQQLPQNSYDKMVAQGQVQQLYNGLNTFIGQSKQEGENERQVNQDWLKNPHLFSDSAHQQMIQSQNSPMSSDKFIKGSDYGNLQRGYDPQKVNESLDMLHQKQLESTPYSNPIQSEGYDKLGNKTGVVTHNERSLQPTDVLHNLLNAYTIGDNDKAMVDNKYANIQSTDGDPQKTLMMRIQQQALDRGDLTQDANGQLQVGQRWKQSTTPAFKADYKPQDPVRPSFRDIQYHNKYGKWPTGDGTDNVTTGQLTPAQTLITNVQNQVPGSGEKLLSLAPKTNNYDKGQSGTLQPTSHIDPNTGEHVFYFPRQVDPKITATNNAYKAAQSVSGSDIDPSKIKDDTKFPETTYKLNPISPDYTAKMAQIAKEQNINLPQLNQIESVKGGHGVIPQAQTKQVATPHVQPTDNSMIKVNLNGRVGNIPLKNYIQFKKENPTAQRIQ